MKKLFIVFFVVMLSGCATIMTKRDQRVFIDSTPQGAEVTVNGDYRGQTPLYLNVPRSRKPLNVEVRLYGYRAQSRVVRPHTSRWMWGNLLLSGAIVAATEMGVASMHPPRYADYPDYEHYWYAKEDYDEEVSLMRLIGYGGAAGLLAITIPIDSFSGKTYPKIRFNLAQDMSMQVAARRMAEIETAVRQTTVGIQQNARVSVVLVSVRGDRELSELITGDLEYALRQQQLVVADRIDSQHIMDEMEISRVGVEEYERAVLRSGGFEMVDYILTANMEGSGSARRIRIRITDTRTGNLVNTGFANIPSD